MNWQIYIPSYKRAGDVTSHKIFPSAKIVVPESQLSDYQSHYGGQVVSIPDDRDGNLAIKRNAILDMAAADGVEWVLMVDDDYRYVGRITDHSNQNGQQQTRWLNNDEIETLIDDGCRMADELQTGMWGLNVKDDPKFYREYSPFSLTTPCLGPWQAVKVSELRYDETIFLKEDYDFWLQSIRKYRKTLRFQSYHYMVNHQTKSGGVVSYRTKQREEEHNQMLQKKWGRRVVKYDIGKSINPRVHIPTSRSDT
tara:strand:- start:1213 stop:1971 length:759 start_codon:yes stop_codon:yes gene_type:complete